VAIQMLAFPDGMIGQSHNKKPDPLCDVDLDGNLKGIDPNNRAAEGPDKHIFSIHFWFMASGVT